jgi:L-glyceraldehyde 3-phosphate reductase
VRFRDIGNTGLRVSEIGFGTGGTAGLMVNGTRQEQRDAVKRALDLGINYFDAAPDYGDGVSEANLGSVLRELGARPVITTKVEVRAEDLADIAGHIELSVEQSLRRLQVEQVDFVQIHNGPVRSAPNLQGRDYRSLAMDGYFRPGGAIDGLDRVVKAGKARFVGFICRGDDAAAVRQLLDTRRFQLINLVYTLLNPSAAAVHSSIADWRPDFAGVIDYAHARGAGVAVYSPLAGGVLTGAALRGEGPHRLSGRYRSAGSGLTAAQDRLRAQASRFAFLAGRDRTLAQAAIRFILMQSGVSVVLGGFSDIDQLEEACAASDLADVGDADLAQIESIWRELSPPADT